MMFLSFLNMFFSERYRKPRGKALKKSREWIMEKKERWRNKGRFVRLNQIRNSDNDNIAFFPYFLEKFDQTRNIRPENDHALFDFLSQSFCLFLFSFCIEQKKRQIKWPVRKKKKHYSSMISCVAFSSQPLKD